METITATLDLDCSIGDLIALEDKLKELVRPLGLVFFSSVTDPREKTHEVLFGKVDDAQG